MNRLSWDTTAPRRPTGERRPKHPRPEDRAVEAEAELLRAAWDERLRPRPF